MQGLEVHQHVFTNIDKLNRKACLLIFFSYNLLVSHIIEDFLWLKNVFESVNELLFNIDNLLIVIIITNYIYI